VLASLALWLIWTFVPESRIVPELIYMEWLVCGVIFILCAIFCKEPANPLRTVQANTAHK
jgi:SSS family solute:Na+ symporter